MFSHCLSIWIVFQGDVHFYGFTDDSWNPQTYPITRFLSETGIQSLPSLDSWFEATKNRSELALDSLFIRHREHSIGQIENMKYIIMVNFSTIMCL